jgi:hypothetical protein
MDQELRITNYELRIKLASLFLILYSLFFIPAPLAQAAEFFFDAPNKEWRVGEEVVVSLFLNTNEVGINAVEGKVAYPRELLELRGIRDGGSVINFWLERPEGRQATGGQGQGVIAFSGITPGGYTGKNGQLFSMVFRAHAAGGGALEARDFSALKNDGLGTAAAARASNFPFAVAEADFKPERPAAKDVDPPEPFRPKIARDPSLFAGRWFLVFATQDKGGGVASYRVKETRQTILNLFPNWIEAESPHELKDQELQSYIFVKAVDRDGNERVQMLEPKYPLPWYENYENWIIIIMIGLALAYGLRRFLKKRIKNQEL